MKDEVGRMRNNIISDTERSRLMEYIYNLNKLSLESSVAYRRFENACYGSDEYDEMSAEFHRSYRALSRYEDIVDEVVYGYNCLLVSDNEYDRATRMCYQVYSVTTKNGEYIIMS